ncbi:HAMP domain-containing sensor histidine kinase [soil metagenome]
MHLAEFIVANRKPILAEWEEFARTCEPASSRMGIAALRDHADGILTMIAADLETPQDAAEQSKKSKGKGVDDSPGWETAAEEHGSGRAESGFSVAQMVAEYRALRASVIRLWTESRGELAPGDIEQLTRFNEAIDQSLAESVVRYSEQLDRAQEISVAIMGHDLRAGLAAIRASASALLETQRLEATAVTLASEIAETADRTTHAVGILLDFTRSRLAEGIPVHRAEASIGTLVRDVAARIEAAHPERRFSVEAGTEERGEWDVERIRQALTNLIENAVQHGTAGTPVTVHVSGNEHDVHVSVHNRGAAIPRDHLDTLFDLRGAAPVEGTSPRKAQEGLGLGLYIAERIVRAHGGSITAKSSEVHGNTFTVCLPRHAPPERRKAAR